MFQTEAHAILSGSHSQPATDDRTEVLAPQAIGSIALWCAGTAGSMGGRLTLSRELCRQIAIAHLNGEAITLSLDGSKVGNGPSGPSNPRYQGLATIELS